MNFSVARVFLILSFLLSLPVGCSHEPPYGDVKGLITFDGKPIPAGAIRFIPLDGATATAGGAIENGRYAVRVPVNQCRVEISSAAAIASPSGKNATTASVELPVELLPPRYNMHSELRHDVRAGDNEANFDLKSI